MLVRLIAAKWAHAQGLSPDVIEGDFSFEKILASNTDGYNVYTWPNHPSSEAYDRMPLNPRTGQKRWLKGSDVDVFEWIFADMDLKDGTWPDKEAFVQEVLSQSILPTRIIDSGNGVHAYWRVVDLEAKSFLRLNRRLCRKFETDEAVTTLNQLMRVENTLNVKDPDNFRVAEVIWDEPEISYTAEQLDQWLPPIKPEDEAYCVRHYDQCYQTGTAKQNLGELPKRFLELCKHDEEIKDLYFGQHKDRSAADFRLGLVLFNKGFGRDDATAVLARTSKASERRSGHAYTYGANIVEKIWTEEEAKVQDKQKEVGKKFPITSIADILTEENIEGERIYCNPMIDATERGFRLGDVLGLIAGQGNGKTSVSLNLFRWFTEFNVNKEYVHLFVSLEMPKNEITQRWKLMAEELTKTNRNVDWNRIVYVLDNYEDDGTYRELGLDDIEQYVFDLEKATGKKVGCLVVDHLGILRQKRSKKDSEFEGLTGVAKRLKATAMRTKTFFIIQSQTSRAKNAGGDVELDMDAAFGVSAFESFCDFVMTAWQPLKRVVKHMEQGKQLFVTAFKFAKIRNKNPLADSIQEDQVYGTVFNPMTNLIREMTSDEINAYDFWNAKATNLRKQDRKLQPSQLATISWTAKKRENGKHTA